MRDISAYRKPMKDFLSKFMRRIEMLQRRYWELAAECLERTCDNVVASL